MKEKVTELIEVKNKIQEMATDWMNQLSEKEFEEKIKRLTPEQQVLVRNLRYTGVGKERVVLEKSNRKE